MKTMDELNQLLSQQAPSDPLVKLLNDTFGPLGWEYTYVGELKVNCKVNEGAFFCVTRAGETLKDAAGLFGLEVKNEPAKETPVQDSAEVGAAPDRMGQSAGESKPAVPAGTPKPSRKVINDSISECSRVILAKKLRSQDQLVKMVEAFMVKRKEELNEGQALKLLEQLKEILQ